MKTISILLLCVVGVVLAGSSEEPDSTEFGVVPGRKATTCPCGKTNKGGRRIVGGKETGVNEYPFMAGMMTKRFKIVICGGSIISDRWVLTAAHCTDPYPNVPLSVVVGEHDTIRKMETEATVIIDVMEVVQHENYGKLAHPNDIALLYLQEEIKFNKFVSPVCLPTRVENINGKFIKVIGWGRTATEGPSSNVLLKVNLKVVSTEECNRKNRIPIKTDAPRQFCTGGNGTRDSCKGDSGGPLIVIDEETNMYVQHGIVSYGFGCATDMYGVNTNVAHYLDWIHNSMKKIGSGSRTCSKKV